MKSLFFYIFCLCLIFILVPTVSAASFGYNSIDQQTISVTTGTGGADGSAYVNCTGAKVLLGNGSCETTADFGGVGAADGNASSICSGASVLLGNGSCQITSDFGATDTNESDFVYNMVGNCSANQQVFGIDEDGKKVCVADATGGAGSNPFDQVLNTTSNVTFNHISIVNWSNLTLTYNVTWDESGLIDELNSSVTNRFTVYNDSAAAYTDYVNTTCADYTLYVNTTAAAYTDAEVAGVSGGNASWNESYADSLDWLSTYNSTYEGYISFNYTHLTNFTDDLTHTVDTSASVNCSGDEVFLGNGSCQTSSDFAGSTPLTNIFDQDLNTTDNVLFAGINTSDWSNVSITESQITDLDHVTNDEITLNILNITGTDDNQCTGTDKVINVTFINGDLQIACDTDVDTGGAGDGSAYINCSTTEVFLGNGSCQDSNDFLDDTDTNESLRFGNLVGNCSADQQVFGIDADGKKVCVSDATGAGGKDAGNPFLYNTSATIYFNETIQNNSITDIADEFNSSMATFVIDTNATAGTYAIYVNDTCADYTLYVNTTAAAYTDAQVAGVSGGNATWNESYADTIYSDIIWGYNMTIPADAYTDELNTSVTNRLTVYNDSAADYTDYVNSTAGTYTLYVNTTAAAYTDAQLAGASGDGSAYVNCSTAEVFLGNGSCQDSNDFLDDTDTNESARFTYLVDNDCGGTDKVIGVEPNGTLLCSSDLQGGGGSNPFDQVLNTTSNVTFNHISLVNWSNLTLTYNATWDESGLIDDLNSSVTNRFTVYNDSAADYTDYVNTTAGSYTLYVNTTAGQYTDAQIASVSGDGSAFVNCSGIEVFLGNGSCQDSDDFIDDTDTNESARFTYLEQDDCGGTDKVVGVEPNGTLLCAADQTGGAGGNPFDQVLNTTSNVTFNHIEIVNWSNMTLTYNVTWDESGLIDDLNASVTNRFTVYNDSAADYSEYLNDTCGDYTLYVNSTMKSYVDASSGTNHTNVTFWLYNDTWEETFLIDDLNASVTNRFTVYNDSAADYTDYVNTTAGTYTDYLNTTAASYSDYLNVTMAAYVQNETAIKNMTHNNITTVECIVFTSGGSICSG